MSEDWSGVSPLFVELAILVYTRPPEFWTDHPSWDSSAGRIIRSKFRDLKMLDGEEKGPALEAYINAICRVNMPVQKFVVPGDQS